MNTLDEVCSRFREEGVRLTPVRKAVVSVFIESGRPMGFAEIASRLEEIGLTPNKTTVYREIDFLVSGGLVVELSLGGGRKCYEWASGHHHHLVCRSCHRIEELEAHEMEPAFEKFEKSLSRKSSFAELSHSLEFYGICNQCR